MYTTFSSADPQVSENEGAVPTARTRRTRRQVARACIWCRIYRIKCDSNSPCRNCKLRGRECQENGESNELRTFSHAIKEVRRLSQRVKELEEELGARRVRRHDHGAKQAASTLSSARLATTLPEYLDPWIEHGGNEKYWECIHTRTAKSQQRQCYGPSSSFYFIGRMSAYLGVALKEPHSERQIQPQSASTSFTSPHTAGGDVLADGLALSSAQQNFFTRAEEERFLELFWHSYHCVYPIIDETEVRAHYQSLWTNQRTSRRPSAVVDILLAVSMQYGVALMPGGGAYYNHRNNVNSDDVTIAGRHFYRRCQILLTEELEGPSIATLQCNVFSVIYLSNASFQNMAHSTLAMAIRIGIMLGLHLEPSDHISRGQREFRKRLWWTLYVLEMKFAMDLGRPLAVNISQVTCGLPSCEQDVASVSDTNPADLYQGSSSLEFNVQYIRLILATRAVYITFYRKSADVLRSNDDSSLYNNAKSLESCAVFLVSKIEFLQSWFNELPDALQTKRRTGGQPFSTDRSMLDTPQSTPLWFQRQRLLLELLYHNLSMNLYRPFVSFFRNGNSSTPMTEACAVSCVNHAMTITQIVHQALTESDVLNGWHEVFQWQWNATLSLVGFILAYPISTSTQSARKSIDRALGTFELLGDNFAIAVSALNVTRSILAKADLLITQFRGSVQKSNASSTSHIDEDPQDLEVDSRIPGDMFSSSLVSTPIVDFPTSMHDTLSSSLGLSYTLDSFNDLEAIYTGGTMVSDMWDFGQNQQPGLFFPD